MNEKILGVSVEVNLGLGMPIRINGDCYCGEFFSRKAKNNNCVVLSARIAYPHSKKIHCFIVDENKVVKPQNGTMDDFGKLFSRKISLETNGNGICHTKYPNNNLRLLKLDSDGQLEIWEIALISQDGEFFVTTQKTYAAKFYWDTEGGKVVCPRFEKKWPQVVEMAKGLLSKNVILNSVKKYESDLAEERKERANLNVPKEPKTGRVLWWNCAQGFGLIRISNGEVARIHWSEVVRCALLSYLKEGEEVRYDGLRVPRGNTSFKKEAIGVMPI
ncbi:MAG: hypothetical protein AAB516_02400 [Patescibacteria group bacterium]